MKKIFFTLLAYFSIGQSFAATAETAFGTERVTENLRLGWNDLVWTIDNILWYVISLVYFIAIIFAIYSGFVILTSAWDEEKVKKWKKTFLFVLAWLILILLASQIVRWVSSILNTESSTNVITSFILK